jgi:hypothetical protein
MKRRLPFMAHLRRPAMSAPWSLLEGKQTFPNVDYKRSLHYDPQDTEGRLKGKTVSPLQRFRRTNLI